MSELMEEEAIVRRGCRAVVLQPWVLEVFFVGVSVCLTLSLREAGWLGQTLGEATATPTLLEPGGSAWWETF